MTPRTQAAPTSAPGRILVDHQPRTLLHIAAWVVLVVGGWVTLVGVLL